MHFIKKYYPMAISMIYIVFSGYIIGASINENFYVINEPFIISLYMIFILVMIVVLPLEIIIFMIHSAKNSELNNRGLWLLMIYVFNVFIIPYYNLKYVVKEKNVKAKMIVFIILSVLATIGGAIIPFI